MIEGPELISLIDTNTKEGKTDSVLSFLSKKEFHTLINYPMEAERQTPADDWFSYDVQAFGVIIESVNDEICSVSFRMNMSDLLSEKGPVFKGEIDGRIEKNSCRKDVRDCYGSPDMTNTYFDQYLLNKTLVLGLIYDTDKKDQLIIASIGSRRIFSNNILQPNRWSLIFDSMNMNPR